MARTQVFSWELLELRTLKTRSFLFRLPEILSRWRHRVSARSKMHTRSERQWERRRFPETLRRCHTAESLSNRSLRAEFCAAVNCQKRWRQKATSPANKRIATAISVNPALILSIGREWGQSKFTFSEASAKTSWITTGVKELPVPDGFLSAWSIAPTPTSAWPGRSSVPDRRAHQVMASETIPSKQPIVFAILSSTRRNTRAPYLLLPPS